MSYRLSTVFCVLLCLLLAGCSGGASVVDNDPVGVDGNNTTAGASTDGNATAGNTTAGVSTDGNATAGNTTVGASTDGNATAGDTTVGVSTDGNTTDGGHQEPDNPPANNAYGLTERAALASINLPIDGVRLGNYRLVNAFPNLRFLEALFVDSVPGQNRLVVVEQQGRIKVFDNNPDTAETKEILDIRSKIAFTSEQGLLGFAFDPNFQNNRFVYLYYTHAEDNRSVLSRMPWNQGSDTLDVSQEKVILQVEQPYTGHNGGMIAFGPDNYLYIALGDGGDGGDPHNHGQNRATLLGNVLRIDVHPSDTSRPYGIPASNPFVDESGVRGEIFAFGFRNPWRFSFDRQTGDLWLGDVGQQLHEEINVVKAGGNYGWRVYEGTAVNNPWHNDLTDLTFTPPVHEYTHDKGLAVIGGYVYRGAVASLRGRYLYSDFYGGTITALSYDGNNVVAIDEVGTVDSPTSFGETADGEVLVVSRYEGLFKFVEDQPSDVIPTELSQTGLFRDLASLTPSSGIVEYTPGHPLWSDGTRKRRWVGVPDNSKVEFTDDDWTFPIGSVAIKHFDIELTQNRPESAKRLETRVMYHTLQGWQGYTYRWNTDQTDANLIADRQTESLTVNLANGSTRTQQYDYPSRTDCVACHSGSSTHLLGLETAQLNTDFTYGDVTDNQLRSWNHIGLFNRDIGEAATYRRLPPLTDNSASIEARARAYLDVNCSVCHQPTGSAPTNIDLRATTAINSMNILNIRPQSGSFGIADASIVQSGSKERSVLWHRMNSLGSERMPPLSTHVVDEAAVDIIGQWIDLLQP